MKFWTADTWTYIHADLLTWSVVHLSSSSKFVFEPEEIFKDNPTLNG